MVFRTGAVVTDGFECDDVLFFVFFFTVDGRDRCAAASKKNVSSGAYRVACRYVTLARVQLKRRRFRGNPFKF